MIHSNKTPFNDGVLSICTTNEAGKPETVKKTMRFGNKVVGYKRYFAARSGNEEITKMVTIPYCGDVSSLDAVVIKEEYYEIVQAQPAKHNDPPETILSLRKRGINI